MALATLRKGLLFYTIAAAPTVTYYTYTTAIQAINQSKLSGESRLTTLRNTARITSMVAGLVYIVPITIIPIFIATALNPDLKGIYKYNGHILTIK